MKGSEKQIQWAEDIRRKILLGFDEILKQSEKYPESDRKQEIVAQLHRRRDALVSAEYASDIINCYSLAASYRTIDDVTRGMLAAWKGTVPNTNGMAKLLDK